MIAEITAAADHVDTEDGWRVRLRQRFLAARQVMLRHPWAPGITDPALDWCDSQTEFEFTLDQLFGGLERLHGQLRIG